MPTWSIANLSRKLPGRYWVQVNTNLRSSNLRFLPDDKAGFLPQGEHDEARILPDAGGAKKPVLLALRPSGSLGTKS